VRERTAELERSEEALRVANKQKDLFLATLAHELRNPLAPLRTGLDILLHQPDQSAAALRTLGAMNRQLTHMVRLIDDLLDVSRISRGRLEMRMQQVDLAVVLDAAIEAARPLLARLDQNIELDRSGPLPALVDATRVAQVVSNLLSNASKHSPQGATIRVALARDGGEGVIRVSDSGVGIPTDQIERVFNMFTKIERTLKSATDGLGVGLALSRQLAELHGGTLSVASAGEGKGATFTLSLPLGSANSAAAPAAKSEAPPPATGSLKVVVVEDNEDAADMMTMWLTRLGHEVRVAYTGPDGLAAIMESRPDVVLCDIGLPDMDGVEVCKRVVQGMPTPPLMIALTGWGMEADRQRTVDAGFHHHLVKPVAMDKLQAVLQSVRAAGDAG
jgi:CheY-like chemotaxis protein/two-component sensor histidine kinase